MVMSVTKGGTQKLPKIFKIVETYLHDHSLESSWGALRFSIQSFSGVNAFSEFFSNNSFKLVGAQ
jgi:hypothetical protein